MAMLKRILSAALALVLLLSCVPMTALAAETEEPTITTEAPAEAPVETTEAPAETAEEPPAPVEEPVEETAVPTEAPAEEPTEEPTVPAEEPTEAPAAPIETEEATAAQEAMNATTSGTCGDNVSWTFNDSTGVLTISGTGAMEDYEYYTYTPWYSFKDEIKSVVIKNGVTSIGDYAFQGCYYLTSVTIPDSVTAIGSHAFYFCDLKNVTIPASVTYIGNHAFGGCTMLTSITVLGSDIEIDDGAFSYCGITTAGPIGGGYDFEFGWTKTIPEWAFYYCVNLTSVTIPDSVTEIGDGAFTSCTALTSIDIPDSVTSIRSSAFWNCSSLTSINIPDGVTSIGWEVFQYCVSLPSITIPESVTSIDRYAFDGCTSLTEINFLGDAPQIESDSFNDVVATAYYPAGNSTWTASVMQDYGGDITWVATDPSVPMISKAINVATGIQVYWDKVSGASKYGVWRSTSANGPYTLVATTVSTMYTDTKVNAGTTYYYRVTAIDASGTHSNKSAIADITHVTAPKVVAATSGAYAYWEAIPGATKYGVWCSKNGANGNFELLGTTTATNYTNRNVPSGSTYYYAISIVNADGNHSALSKSINHTFLSTPTSSVSNVATGVKVSWNKINGALGYAVYRKTYTSSVWTRVHTIKDGDTLSWTDESVRAKNGQGYHYTVRALAGSKLTIQSAQRINGTPIVRLTSQTLKSAVKVSATAIKCTWSTSTVVAGYEVRLMTGGTVYKTYKVPGKTTASKALTGLPRGKTYTVQIRTYATLGTGTYYSAWSNAKSVTLP